MSPFLRGDPHPVNFHLQRVGECVTIRQAGHATRTYTRSELYKEIDTSGRDPDRNYVIYRAIDLLEGKSPKSFSGGTWVDRWAVQALQQKPKTGSFPINISGPTRRKKRSGLPGLWDRIFGK
jgi:hypothetical protein